MLIQDDARSYHRWQFRIGASRLLISAGYLYALLATGLSARLRDDLDALTPHWWLAVPVAVVFACIILAKKIDALPDA